MNVKQCFCSHHWHVTESKVETRRLRERGCKATPIKTMVEVTTMKCCKCGLEKVVVDKYYKGFPLNKVGSIYIGV